jgi:hypothetical protein
MAGDDGRIATLIEELKDLRVQETNLLRQIEEANRQRESNTRPTYQVGDRVYITSRIRRPAFAPRAWTEYNERRATVTKVVGGKVFIETDNGTKTWRTDKNLRVLSP